MISVECGLDQGHLGSCCNSPAVRDKESGVRRVAEKDERRKWIRRVVGCGFAVLTGFLEVHKPASLRGYSTEFRILKSAFEFHSWVIFEKIMSNF